jgi:hypothetical protein
MRLIGPVVISLALILIGCSTALTSSSPYKQPEGPSTANVRFRVANISREAIPHFSAVLLSNYADAQCGESSNGRYIDEIGANKTFVSRANQSIGMPNPEAYPAHMYVERRFSADGPVVFSVVVTSGGPQRLCQSTYQFRPSPGQMYEVSIDVRGPRDCPVQVAKLHFGTEKLNMSVEPTATQLPNFCQRP